MYRYLLFLLMLLPFSGQCCDGCGALANVGGIGLLTNFRSNSVSLGWYYAPFSAHERFGQIDDQFNTFDIRLRLQLFRRWRLNLRQGYQFNERQQPGFQLRLNGLTDTDIQISYALFEERYLANGHRIHWEVGSGVALPTGKYDDQSISDRSIPDNINIRKGIYALLFQSNLI